MVVMLGWQLDLVILVVFSNINNFIPYKKKLFFIKVYFKAGKSSIPFLLKNGENELISTAIRTWPINDNFPLDHIV